MAPLNSLGRGLLLLSFATNALSEDASDDTSNDTSNSHAVITVAEKDLPSWATDNTLQLELSTDSASYAIIPLTEVGSDVEPGVSCCARVSGCFKNGQLTGSKECLYTRQTQTGSAV